MNASDIIVVRTAQAHAEAKVPQRRIRRSLRELRRHVLDAMPLSNADRDQIEPPLSRSMRRCDCSSTGLSRHHSLHFVLLVKLDRAIHARRLHTLAMSSNTDASCVHSQSFMVCKYCVLRSHTLSSVCLTLVEKAGLVLALRSFRCSNPSIYPYTPDVAAPMRQRVRYCVPSRWR
jgi:hypothetical protein